MPAPRAIVFDCDGLLLDTETVWTRAEMRLFGDRGITFTAEHKRDMIGTSGAQAAATLERHLGEPGHGPALMDELHAMMDVEMARGAEPMPGARALVDALRERGVPIGLASNSPRGLVDIALRVSGFGASFDEILSGYEVARPKPAPDVYAEICRRLGAAPADAVALEDSPTGVTAAVAAGMFTIAVPSMEGVDLSAAQLQAGSLEDTAVHTALGLERAA